jgi:hypothetical protein
MKKLTHSDVTFEVCLESDPFVTESDIREAFSSGDPELDRKDADAIIERLKSGDETAWCTILVKASWRGIEADDSVSGVTLGGPDDSAEAYAEEFGMKDIALGRLNRLVAAKRSEARKFLKDTQ